MVSSLLQIYICLVQNNNLYQFLQEVHLQCPGQETPLAALIIVDLKASQRAAPPRRNQYLGILAVQQPALNHNRNPTLRGFKLQCPSKTGLTRTPAALGWQARIPGQETQPLLDEQAIEPFKLHTLCLILCAQRYMDFQVL